MPGEEKVWLRDNNFTSCGVGGGDGATTIDANADHNNYCSTNGDRLDDGKLLRPYDMSEMMEMTQTTQPLIGLNERDINGYKDKISGSSRYASTTSTLAD